MEGKGWRSREAPPTVLCLPLHPRERMGQKHQEGGAGGAPPGRPYSTAFLWSSMLRPRPRISLVSTSKETGVPGSRMFRPLTIDS